MSWPAQDSELTTVDLPPPPRRVRGGPGLAIWFGRVFVLPHTLVGLGILVAVAVHALWVLFGVETTGHVEGAHTGSRKGQTTYWVQYSYQTKSGTLTSSSDVPQPMYRALSSPLGREIQVSHYELGPVHLSGLADVGSPLGRLGAMMFFAAFWNGIMSVFLYGLWVMPYRQKQLVALGTATSGKVVRKRTQQRKNTTYYVSYAFETAAGEPVQAEMSTSRALFQKVEEEQAVTVIYWPEQPSRSTVQGLGDYQAELS
jgi:hypothetical protein